MRDAGALGEVKADEQGGAIRSETSATWTAKVYKAGDSFLERGSEHLVSENASTTEPASLLGGEVHVPASCLRPPETSPRPASHRTSSSATAPTAAKAPSAALTIT
jgi:hypothetical protein